MEIRFKPKEKIEVTLNYLEKGSVFQYCKGWYIKTDETSNDKIKIVRLDNGVITHMDRNDFVTPVQGHFVVIE